MRKSVKILLLIMFLCIFALFCAALAKHSYAGSRPFPEIPDRTNIGLTVGIIGDSWVERDSIGEFLVDELAKNYITAKIIKSGEPGATSKKIYENLFKNPSESFSSRRILDARPKYCIVFAGVNDAARHMGKDFYVHHVRLITEVLQHYNIRPVLVLLPDFGVERNYAEKNIFIRTENDLYELWDNDGEINNIKSYRQALMKALESDEKVIIFNPDSQDLIYSRKPEFFADPLHLNRKGYKRLSAGLALAIKKHEACRQ